MHVSGEHILRTAQAWAAAGRKVAIATVIETWGSAPRRAGSQLIVDAEGSFLGSVSGGCVEADVVTAALEVIETGRPRLVEFGVADATAWQVGLSCGGRITIYVEPVGRLRDLLAGLIAEIAARRVAVLVTDLAAGTQRLVCAADLATDPFAEQIEERLRLGTSGSAEVAGRRVFFLVQIPRRRLVVVGAVHVAQALAPLAQAVDLNLMIVDPRTAFATPERFPHVTLVAEWPQEALPRLGLDRFTALVALSHDPKIDDPALALALGAGCFYVGALGSRKTHAQRRERLRAAGITEPRLDTIHAPIGLDIGAVSPAEIAVAILAEIIATARGKSLRAQGAA